MNAVRGTVQFDYFKIYGHIIATKKEGVVTAFYVLGQGRTDAMALRSKILHNLFWTTRHPYSF